MKNTEAIRRGPVDQKEQWQNMKLVYVGNVGELVLGGGGKITFPGGDPGEGRKQSIGQ